MPVDTKKAPRIRKTGIHLHVYTRESTNPIEYHDVIEYVQGPLFLYVHLNDKTVVTHARSSILKVIRYNDMGNGREICLKTRFSKQND